MATPPLKKISLRLQQMALMKAFPDSESVISKNELVWRGHVVPTLMCRCYKLELRYKLGRSPQVSLVEPQMETRHGEKPPHLYQGDILCLYFPGEWNGSMFLVNTILPWASEWLLHYEIWLACGEWKGGGKHPSSPKPRPRDDQEGA